MKIIKYLILAILPICLCGCAGTGKYEIVDANNIILYVSTPMSHTIYMGSDKEWHYFVWEDNFSSGKWKVDKMKLKVVGEMPVNTTGYFVFRNKSDEIQVVGSI